MFKLILKSFEEISFILIDLDTLKKIIIKPTNCATMVAIPIPDIPNAGIGPKPNINKGFNNIFKRKLKIRTFLYVLVSPSACRSEFKAITLHPRTTKQSYKGDADWSLIKLLKESTNIPVIGNGDIKTPEDVIRMFEKTSCDGVMVGRSSLGNPWFFKQAVALFEGKKIEQKPTLEDKVNCCRQHFIKMIEWHGERIAVNLMKKHFGWYIRGFQKSSTIRKALVSAQNQDTIISILDAIA